MARPKRENADYFSHDAGMRDDPKVKALRNKFGITGYAVWCMMLEILTNSDFFKREIDELEIEILSADFGIESDLFSEILSYMVRLKLLQTADNCEYLSQKLTERLQPVTDKRNKARNRVVSVTESTQSKVKETKEKKTTNKKEKNEKNEKKFIAPSISEVSKFFDDNGYKKEAGEKAFNYYQDANWKDARGNQVKNWKQKMRGVWFKDENKKQESGYNPF